mmetsp:Transcript_6499/g.18140  ORF Transcript_6499/g.18140 Transcript_6499/m.18140 type:complete len:112 (-) Transcript_6499:743-1078(-)
MDPKTGSTKVRRMQGEGVPSSPILSCATSPSETPPVSSSAFLDRDDSSIDPEEGKGKKPAGLDHSPEIDERKYKDLLTKLDAFAAVRDSLPGKESKEYSSCCAPYCYCPCG